MSATIDPTSAASDLPESGDSSWTRALNRLDDWCERFGDAVNPILVKETRQALKSRQFVVTFSLLLIAALGWTILGSLSIMPQIYTTPSAPRLMIGYYVVLAIPMLLVVPLAAYRSLEGEIDDGTLELLTITTLSPWQIVLGKLAGASLQMLLYFVTLFPCLAFAYSLRGVDLPTTLLIVAALGVSGLFLTILGLFFAPVSRGRTNRVISLLALLILLLLGEYLLGAWVINMLLNGNPLSARELMYVVVAFVALAVCFGHLLLTATAAQLTPETENRSTPLRLSLLASTAVMVMLTSLAIFTLDPVFGAGIFVAASFLIAGLWSFSGSLMVGERSTMTPRIRRQLPNSFLSRVFVTWLTPGPTTGLVFAISVIGLLTVLHQQALGWMLDSGYVTGRTAGDLRRMFEQPGLLYPAYLICMLAVVRALMFLVRLKNNPRVEVGLAASVVIAMMAALAPYSMQLHFNDYQPLQFDPTWQTTNWAYAIVTATSRGVPDEFVWKIVAAAAGASALAVIFAWPATRPRRIATPDRVVEELAKN